MTTEAAHGSVGVIWAQARDGVIGRDGDMPWHAPADMAHFKATTMGHPVVMGRRTWDSIPPRFRPFTGRTTIVLTRDDAAAVAVRDEGGLVASSLDEALSLARSYEGGELVWVVGGGSVYAQAMARADVASVTILDLEIPDGDTHAPELSSDFIRESAAPEGSDFAPQERGPALRIERWVR